MAVGDVAHLLEAPASWRVSGKGRLVWVGAIEKEYGDVASCGESGEMVEHSTSYRGVRDRMRLCCELVRPSSVAGCGKLQHARQDIASDCRGRGYPSAWKQSDLVVYVQAASRIPQLKDPSCLSSNSESGGPSFKGRHSLLLTSQYQSSPCVCAQVRRSNDDSVLVGCL